VRELPKEMVLPASMVPDKFPDPPVTPKDAATVVLLRDTSAGPEAFLLRRVMGMAFAGGMSVFPGGGVDRRDADAAVAWTGPPASWWASRFSCPVPLARALVCAAVRETFEESGVLLAGPDAGSVVSDTRPYAAARKSLVDREFSLAQFLSDAGLVLRADLLRPWANWVTPVEEPRRYDTKFFIAALPEGQRADGSTSEADHAEWRRPAAAIDMWKAGERGLLPPTWMTLSDLAELPTVAAAMAVEREIDKIIPKVIRDGRVLRPVLPGDPDYARAANRIDAGPDDTLETR
jgi:8-oxo-dGTP pyrophosphatase MutT (NUDIX family)